ncbi:MAG: IclR family transcriptional regulator domain-containing protein [Candidatus Limnocylindria bacterium]
MARRSCAADRPAPRQAQPILRALFAVDDEENEPHTRCIGAAVVDSSDLPIGGLSLSSLVFDLDAGQVRRFAPLVVSAARDVSAGARRHGRVSLSGEVNMRSSLPEVRTPQPRRRDQGLRLPKARSGCSSSTRRHRRLGDRPPPAF